MGSMMMSPDDEEDLKRYKERLNKILDSDIYSIERIEHDYPVVIPGGRNYQYPWCKRMGEKMTLPELLGVQEEK